MVFSAPHGVPPDLPSLVFSIALQPQQNGMAAWQNRTGSAGDWGEVAPPGSDGRDGAWRGLMKIW